MVNKRTYSMKRAGVIVGLFFLSLLPSCGADEKIVARVDDHELTETEAQIIMEHLGYDYANKADRIQFLNNWCELEAMRIELETKAPELSETVRLKAGMYMGELSRYYLIDELIRDQTDTSISTSEIKAYYQAHLEDFKLQDYLVKALFIKIPRGSKPEAALKEHFLLKNDKDLAKVNSYVKLYAEDFYFDDEEWIYFTELSKNIPLGKLNRDNLVLNRTKTYFSDEEFTYYINIIDYTLKDTPPPLDFVETQIKELILTGRMNQLRQKREKQLIQQVKRHHEINIHP
ncbi:MAG: hypothetical protein LW704_08065 [Cryomorphaceae bacterium]|nr:hypothetical protein [Cryomorphaceae bacterium]